MVDLEPVSEPDDGESSRRRDDRSGTRATRAARLADGILRGLGGGARRSSSRSCRSTTSACWWPRSTRADGEYASRRSTELVGAVAWVNRPASWRSSGAKPRGTRPSSERVHDWREVYLPIRDGRMRTRARAAWTAAFRSAISGCPLDNLIPDWNDLVYRERWQRRDRSAARDEQLSRVHRPDLSGAVRGVLRARHQRRPGDDQGDRRCSIIERAFDEGWITAAAAGQRAPASASPSSARGPAGLARAPSSSTAPATRSPSSSAPTASAVCSATAFPNSSWRSAYLDRRLALLRGRGRRGSAPGVDVGANVPVGRALRGSSTRSCSAAGRTRPAICTVPGRELAGIHFAMDYLTAAEPPAARRRGRAGRRCMRGGGESASSSSAAATPGADCLGTAHRQGARSVHQFELLPRPPRRAAAPIPGRSGRTSSACRPRTTRAASASTRVSTERVQRRRGRPRVHAARGQRPDESARTAGRVSSPAQARNSSLDADLVLLAMGFPGPERHGLISSARRAVERTRQCLAR